jgi:hypothetical protein
MAVTPDKAAPYAPASAVLALIERHRSSRPLPSPINADVLGRSGLVSDSLVPRTMQALVALDLINETGEPTPTLEGIRRAPEGEYKQRLMEWLNGAYADVIQYVDPATADETAIRDAFRLYSPAGQQARMVTLFTGLYAGAGVTREAAGPPRVPRAVAPRRTATPNNRTPPKPLDRTAAAHHPAGLPPVLAGLLASLPPPEGWTQEARDKFMATFGTVLDFCFPIVEAAPTNGEGA